jgi:hypothetical protein
VRMTPDGEAAVGWRGLRLSPGDRLRVVVTTPLPMAGPAVAVPARSSR